jgi:hypothetical protein
MPVAIAEELKAGLCHGRLDATRIHRSAVQRNRADDRDSAAFTGSL